MNLPLSIMSDIITYMKYANYDFDKKRKETWEEIVDRNKDMHLRKFPELKDEIQKHYKLVYDKKVFPSLRAMQFGGKAIEANNIRSYNCSYAPLDSIESFSEVLYILLCGTGAGYSVQPHHINQLPEVHQPQDIKSIFVVEDSIEGWSDSILALMKCYLANSVTVEIYDKEKIEKIGEDISLLGTEIDSIKTKIDFDTIKPKIEFDYSEIRPKGSLIRSSTAKAPGPDGLRKTHEKIVSVLEKKKTGDRLTSLECHDIVCHISDCVLSGGVRRSSLIAFFSPEDDLMMECKSGEWYIDNPQRGNANNSAVFYRPELTKERFNKFFDVVEASGAGEPGIFLSNDPDKNVLSNPCAEISLYPYQFCNLCEIISKDIESKEDFIERVEAATFIGTLQASYTNFPYLRDKWRKQTEKEALLGVSITGLASGDIKTEWLKEGAEISVKVNQDLAKKIGINASARITTVKPSGTSSLLAGTSSGIHAWHAPYYIRRITVLDNEAIYVYLKENNPELIETIHYNNSEGKFSHTKHTINIPIKAPEGAIFRDENEIDFLERVKNVNLNWISPTWNKGLNSHNVSCTVSVKDWDSVREWMWVNRDTYTGIALLPYWEENTMYQQLPHETISKEKYEELILSLSDIDLTKITDNDFKNLELELACSTGNCEI